MARKNLDSARGHYYTEPREISANKSACPSPPPHTTIFKSFCQRQRWLLKLPSSFFRCVPDLCLVDPPLSENMYCSDFYYLKIGLQAFLLSDHGRVRPLCPSTSQMVIKFFYFSMNVQAQVKTISFKLMTFILFTFQNKHNSG